MTSRWPLALVLAVTAACRSAAPVAHPQAPAPAAPAAAPSSAPTAFRASEAIRWTRDSAEHRALFLQVYRAATATVEREAAARASGTWAVVLDADETVIDNSPYQLERARAGQPFDPASWKAWCARREAVPLPGASAFLSRVRALGGKIAIVTNRSAAECPDTEAVFRAHGLAYDTMLCKPDGSPSDKNPRFVAVARGTTPAGLPPLEVVAFLGDNIQDFPEKGQSIRERGDEAFADFGARFFVLPNPMYGSWERN
jgi:5'-nucleotidase (lipoprotein e(P4) family)